MTEIDAIIENEGLYRLASFFSIFILIALWELLAPRRKPTLNKAQRWLNNLGLVLLNTILLRLLQPITAIALAAWVSDQQWGLLNLLPIPWLLQIILAVILLDLAIYLQHRLFHAVPALWRLHKVHHVDLDYDVTTGLRFHPIEILLSMLIKYLAILLIGPAAIAVLIFEVLLNVMAMFNHGNIILPKPLDHILRMIIVTPDMHRVHHSVYQPETDSNFGFNLSIWDRLFSSYRAQPRDGHLKMRIGLDNPRDNRQCTQLLSLLKLPFKP